MAFRAFRPAVDVSTNCKQCASVCSSVQFSSAKTLATPAVPAQSGRKGRALQLADCSRPAMACAGWLHTPCTPLSLDVSHTNSKEHRMLHACSMHAPRSRACVFTRFQNHIGFGGLLLWLAAKSPRGAALHAEPLLFQQSQKMPPTAAYRATCTHTYMRCQRNTATLYLSPAHTQPHAQLTVGW